MPRYYVKAFLKVSRHREVLGEVVTDEPYEDGDDIQMTAEEEKALMQAAKDQFGSGAKIKIKQVIVQGRAE